MKKYSIRFLFVALGLTTVVACSRSNDADVAKLIRRADAIATEHKNDCAAAARALDKHFEANKPAVERFKREVEKLAKAASDPKNAAKAAEMDRRLAKLIGGADAGKKLDALDARCNKNPAYVAMSRKWEMTP